MTGNVNRPAQNIWELLAIIAVGLGHVSLEFLVSEKIAGYFSVFAVILFAIYIVWRIFQNKNILSGWGFTLRNIKNSFKPYLQFLIIGTLALFGVAILRDSLVINLGFIFSLVLYPLWGIAQQFVLQNFVANNLRQYFKSETVFIFCVSLLFSVSHYPRILLAGFVMLAGIFITYIYERYPNIWLAGIVHGFLATFVFYWILDLDIFTLLQKTF